MIRVEKLNYWINQQHILQDVSLTVPCCGVTTIVGPSGSGKSSFLSAINGLHSSVAQTHLTGDIFLDLAQPINLLDKSHQALINYQTIGTLFQQANPFPLSIYKNIDLPLKEHGYTKYDRPKIIEQSLQDVGLWNEVAHRLDASALCLSGGQQQRLCIARAIALKPKIILMDEPCSALDPIATHGIEQLILKLKQDYTLVVVTHNLAQAKRIADFVGFFWAKEGCGQLIEFSPAEQLFNQPQHELTQEFLNY